MKEVIRMNKVILLGRLTKDIEVRYTSTGKPVISNTIACKNKFKNKDGEYDSTFINIVVWSNSAEYLNKYGHKGDLILVEGSIGNRSYTKQDGSKGYVTEVNVEELSIVKSKQSNSESTSDQTTQDKPLTSLSPDEIDLTDDLPF